MENNITWIFIIILVVTVLSVINHLLKRLAVKKRTVYQFMKEYHIYLTQIPDLLNELIDLHNDHLNVIQHNESVEISLLQDSTLQALSDAYTIIFHKAKKQILGNKKTDMEAEKALQNLDEIREQISYLYYHLSEAIEQREQLKRYGEYAKSYDKQHICKTIDPLKNKESFFRADGYKNLRELNKRYRELVKRYHPDNGGDNEIFVQINKEYEKERSKFE